MAKAVKMTGMGSDGRPTVFGHVMFDGNGFRYPPGLEWLARAAEDGIVAPDGRGGVRVVRPDEPDAFLDALQYQYRSPYLAADAPEEI